MTLQVCCIVAFSTAAAVAFLVFRDQSIAKRRRRDEERRPPEEQIAKLRELATFMVKEFERVLQRVSESCPQSIETVNTLLAYYRRFEAFTSSENALPDEIEQLANEASAFIRREGWKGIWLDKEAAKLAELVRMRNQSEDNSH